MDLYQEEVMDHYEHPRNQGEMKDPDYEGRDSNASCGDMIQFFVRIGKSKIPNDKSQTIKEVKWRGIGCAITTAAASKLSEYLQGRTLKEVQNMSEDELVKNAIGFEVNPGRIKCLTLPVRVVIKTLIGSK
jgi:nitrogen fixation NifU-like protein